MKIKNMAYWHAKNSPAKQYKTKTNQQGAWGNPEYVAAMEDNPKTPPPAETDGSAVPKKSPAKNSGSDAHNKKFGAGHADTAKGHPQTDEYGVPFDWSTFGGGTDPSGLAGQQILKNAETMRTAELKKSKAAKKKDE